MQLSKNIIIIKNSNFSLVALIFFISGINVLPAFSQKRNMNSILEERSLFYVFHNKEAKLQINKQSWQLEVLDTEEKVHYSEFQKPAFLVNNSWIYLQNDAVIKTVSENSAQLSFPAANGYQFDLFIEKAGDFGFRLKYSLPDNQVESIKGVIKLNMVEEIYGFGETWNGRLAQRGEVLEIWDKGGTPDECAWMPYFVSTNNYAFFLNYGGLVRFDVGQRKADELVYEMPASELEYTVLVGKDIASTVQNFVALTGMPDKPPRWSFEPWFWLMSDPDIPGGNISTLRGEHFLEMVNKLKEMDIPIGVTWLEPPWQTARTTFIPNENFCPNLKTLIAELDKQGVKTLAWTVPYTSPGASNWDEAVINSYLVKKPGGETDNNQIEVTGSGELEGTFYNKIDFYNPEAFQWWQEQIQQSLDLGLKGFKLDAGQGLPIDGILYGGRIGKDVHNSYALEYNKVFHEVLKNKLDDDFLMIPRAAWIGSGGYTNFKWPGDLSGSFANNGVPSSVYSSLSLAFSGIPFVSTDIGGFDNQPAPEEPWIRWAQFGAMLPGMQTLHMPWWYSKEAQRHYRYLAWLHTDLIPYWETLANEAHETGTPVCRPLVWNYQDDQNTWHVEDEFTVGDYLLVAPFMNSDKKRDVYLPSGRWFDFWNDEAWEGEQKIRWFKGWQLESLWKFPLYVKEGAVIPMEIQNNVTGFGSEYSKGFITLAVWPEKDAKNEFILNDREGPIPFTTSWIEENEIVVSWENSSAGYLFRMHIQDNYVPDKIFAKERMMRKFNSLDTFRESNVNGWFFDQSNKKLWIKKFNERNSSHFKISFME
jgi:alpha-D-xyloside xylohydrolase